MVGRNTFKRLMTVAIGIIMAGFVGRKAELNYLQHRFDSGKASVCAICGDANVGKTELVRKFCEDKPHIYISGAPALPSDNLDMISRIISEFSGTTHDIEDVEDIFRTLLDVCGDDQVVIVFDDISTLADNFVGFPQFFNTFRTRMIEDTRIMVIACDRTETHIGRVFNKMTLRPLKFKDCLDFHPGYTPHQHLMAYSIAGGCPAYHTFIGNPPEEALASQFLSGPSALNAEINRILVPNPYPISHYNKVLSIMASGTEASGVILYRLKQEAMAFSAAKVLSDLEEKGIVKKVPSRDTKKEMYVFNNTLFRFYYTVVIPSMVQSGMRIEKVDITAFTKRLDDYMETVFKEVCEEHVSATYSCEFIGKVRKDGDVADPDMDFVASIKENSISRMVVSYCRLKGTPVGIQELERLVKRSKAVQGTGKLYCLFSGQGFTDELRNRVKGDSNVRLTTLDEVCRK